VVGQLRGGGVRGNCLMRPGSAPLPAPQLDQQRGQGDRQREHPGRIIITADAAVCEQAPSRPPKIQRPRTVLNVGPTCHPRLGGEAVRSWFDVVIGYRGDRRPDP
jgi:hypothetical protein